MREDGSNHAGGGRLAVRTGDSDAVFHAHQLGEHFGAGNHRNQAAMCFDHLGVVGLDSCGGDHDIGLDNVLRPVPVGNLPTQFRQPPGDIRLPEIRPRHFVTEVEQNLGNSAHADAADADEVNFAYFSVHIENLEFRL